MNQKQLEVTLDLSVKTYDIDFAGIVSNIVYLRWLENLRLAMLATSDRQIWSRFIKILQRKRKSRITVNTSLQCEEVVGEFSGVFIALGI